MLALLTLLLASFGLYHDLGVPLAVGVAVMLALGVIVALGGLIGTQLAELAQEVPKYASTIREKVDTVQDFAASKMSLAIRRLRHRLMRKPAPATNARPMVTAITGCSTAPAYSRKNGHARIQRSPNTT